MIKLYWWRFVKNFGDALSPWICEKVFNQTIQHASPEAADLAAVGSILHKLPSMYGGYVWGSGILDGGTVMLPKAKIKCVRGMLTNRYMNGAHPVGDPAILVSRFIERRERPVYEYGIIPHYSEKNSPLVRELCKREDCFLIDPQHPIDVVITKISLSRHIVSSSLHGLIVADSFGIPNVWTRFTTSSGIGQFKFFDYFGTIDRKPQYTAIREDTDLSLLPWFSLDEKRRNILQESVLHHCPEL